MNLGVNLCVDVVDFDGLILQEDVDGYDHYHCPPPNESAFCFALLTYETGNTDLLRRLHLVIPRLLTRANDTGVNTDCRMVE